MLTERGLQFKSDNERYLEAARATGVEIRSFDDWKQLGRFVKKGEKQKQVKVKVGYRKAGTDPISGEDLVAPTYRTAYGFTVDQVR